MNYAKIFSTITASTIWQESYPTRIAWVTMLTMADRDGYVYASVPGLARMANVTREECDDALVTLMSEDRDSSSDEHEGRRIESVDRGWHVLNYEKYRDLMSLADKRAKDAERQARCRARKGGSSSEVA
jgi:hypothetical protein